MSRNCHRTTYLIQLSLRTSRAFRITCEDGLLCGIHARRSLMVDEKTKAVILRTGRKLGLSLPGFYGKVVFNYQNGKCVCSNVEQSIHTNDLKKGVAK